MRFGGTIIQFESRRFSKYSRGFGFWIGGFYETLFPGARRGLPKSYISYSHVGLWFWEVSLVVGLRVPPEVERQRLTT